MIQTVTDRRYVTRARQHRAKIFCNTLTPHNIHNAVTSLQKTRKYLLIFSNLHDSVMGVNSLYPEHLEQTSFPDLETPLIRKTGIDPLSRVYNGRRSE